jgi:flagellar biosynthesis chaperone FliJ
MSVKVGRSLDEVDAKVKQLSQSIKEGTKKTKELDRVLKLDPRNVKVAAQQIQNLRGQVQNANTTLQDLRKRQEEANQAFKRNEITEQEFNRITESVQRAERQVALLNARLVATQRAQVEQLAGQFDRVTRSLNNAQRVARTFSRLALGLVGVIGAAVTSFTRHAAALNETAQAYDLCIERLQVKKGVYETVTGSAENYTNSLASLQKRMNQITFGTGRAYENILRHLGVASRDATGATRSLSEVYDEIIMALRDMEDTQLRNQLAYELFGEEAIHIIEILQLTVEEYEELMRTQEEANLISQEQAAAALEIQEQWEQVRHEFMMTGAELATALLPLIKTLAALIQDFILPLLTRIANWFSGMTPFQQKFVVFLILLVIFLPKIIGMFKLIVLLIKKLAVAKKVAAVGAKALSIGMAPLIPIIIAIVAVVTILAFLFAFLTGRSRELRSSLNSQKSSMDGLANSYEGMGNGLDGQIAQVSDNHNRQSHDVNVTIDARGDSPISEDNAQMVADILAERINKELGGKI